MMTKLKPERYKYIEKVLYSYSKNLTLQQIYTEGLFCLELHGDIRVQDYKEGVTVGGVSDKVLDYVHKKHIYERRLSRINMEVYAVERLIRRLEGSHGEHDMKLLHVLEAVYIAGDNTRKDIAGVDEEEIPALRHELVRMCGRNMKKYARNTFCGDC